MAYAEAPGFSKVSLIFAAVRFRLTKCLRGEFTEAVRRESSYPARGGIFKDCSLEISTTTLCVATARQGIVDCVRHWQRYRSRSHAKGVLT